MCVLVVLAGGGEKHRTSTSSKLITPCAAVSTGDMLRAAVHDQTDVGKRAQAVMKAGGLVSNDIVVGIITVTHLQNRRVCGF